MEEELKFIVASHIVQDLGLNLYTTLPKVLVEFVANAYDADSPGANISLNINEIKQGRDEVRAQWNLKKIEVGRTQEVLPLLPEQTLPDNIKIVIEDSGHGMSREDLQTKFLVAGRRRRDEDGETHTKGGRLLMGRKGLGKLAGFGVAHKITIESRKAGESHATRICLDYQEILDAKTTTEIPVKSERLDDGGGFNGSGTRITLSKLIYEPMKSRLGTINNNVGDHFYFIDSKDFAITLNGDPVEPEPREFSYAWPEPKKPNDQLVKKELETEDGETISFEYRLRFTVDRASLSAEVRGIRIYTHNRLAAAPSLLDADTNMHGFRMTDYLDGVVSADFIDDQKLDYIATDRQDLRWESPLLKPLYEFLSDEIKEACMQRQKIRDETKKNEVENDPFTQGEIEKASLSKSQKKIALRIARMLSSHHKQGLEDQGYKNQFRGVVHGLGQGKILTTLTELANERLPDITQVVNEILQLTAEELDNSYQYVKGRLDGISALKKIILDVEFGSKNEESHDGREIIDAGHQS